MRTVLKRDNVVEAISICDATPGPVARIVKTAILNRDKGRERVREAVEEAGLTEVPQLEERLNLLATIAQIAPLLGLLGTILGFMTFSGRLQGDGLYAHISGEDSLAAASGRRSSARRRASPWPFPSTPATIISSAASTKSSSTWNAPPAKSSTSSPKTATPNPMKFPRNAKILRSPFEVAPFAAVFFLLVIFLLLGALLPDAGIACRLQPPPPAICPAWTSRPWPWPWTPAADFISRIKSSPKLQLNSSLSNAVKNPARRSRSSSTPTKP